MGKQKKAKKYAVMKRMISLRDQRIKEKDRVKAKAKKKEDPSAIKEREVIAKDPRFERLPCTHKGTYADDCLVQRVTQHKCYIVATVDRDLKRRIRKIPGVPIMYISNHRYNIERMPDDYGAPRF
ncbi:rRNA-processing protein FCF1 homolog [Varanus komodoensis]|uniref:rRNA-processing protein FCF1 homolog n=1 Tax=Varanus komodoensis TaxID=61221 RepID=UPI001CF7E1A8|nr:rRNA-processing protein FCF1 homolog [Varanus komodoensis]